MLAPMTGYSEPLMAVFCKHCARKLRGAWLQISIWFRVKRYTRCHRNCEQTHLPFELFTIASSTFSPIRCLMKEVDCVHCMGVSRHASNISDCQRTVKAL